MRTPIPRQGHPSRTDTAGTPIPHAPTAALHGWDTYPTAGTPIPHEPRWHGSAEGHAERGHPLSGDIHPQEPPRTALGPGQGHPSRRITTGHLPTRHPQRGHSSHRNGSGYGTTGRALPPREARAPHCRRERIGCPNRQGRGSSKRIGGLTAILSGSASRILPWLRLQPHGAETYHLRLAIPSCGRFVFSIAT